LLWTRDLFREGQSACLFFRVVSAVNLLTCSS
jgi:hypothetical protein